MKPIVLDEETLLKFAEAIKTMEGFRPGTQAWNLNNPGNLIFAGQPGAEPFKTKNGTFAKFATLRQGEMALIRQIMAVPRRHSPITLREFFAGQRFLESNQLKPGGYPGYAPAGHGDNRPDKYAEFVASRIGASPDALLAWRVVDLNSMFPPPAPAPAASNFVVQAAAADSIEFLVEQTARVLKDKTGETIEHEIGLLKAEIARRRARGENL